jgi:hypothetical protein
MLCPAESRDISAAHKRRVFGFLAPLDAPCIACSLPDRRRLDIPKTFLMSAIISSSRPAFTPRNISARSSFSIHVPTGFVLAPNTRTNSTMTDLTGPGRTIGLFLNSAGRLFERLIDRFAEGHLGLGPNMAALRLTAALHNMHANTHRDCMSEHAVKMDNTIHVMDRLIWVCNGCCSQCHAPYVPYLLTEEGGSVAVRKGLTQLINHLRYVR